MGNPLQPGATAGGESAGAFRLRGEAPILRPEVQRA